MPPNEHESAPTSAPAAPTPAANPNAVIEAQVRQVLGVLIRGLMVSAPGVPPEVLVNAIARQTGALLATSITGDLSSVLGVRKGFKDAFADGVAKTPVLPAVPPVAAPQKLHG